MLVLLRENRKRGSSRGSVDVSGGVDCLDYSGCSVYGLQLKLFASGCDGPSSRRIGYIPTWGYVCSRP